MSTLPSTRESKYSTEGRTPSVTFGPRPLPRSGSSLDRRPSQGGLLSQRAPLESPPITLQGATRRTGAAGPPPEPPLADPEDFVAPAGQLLPINRTTPPSPADVYRCAGCERPACAGPSGCAEFQWRNVPGGYLREILASKVYRVAKETPTQLAKGLSASLNVRFYLKREDLQDVHSFKIRGAFNRMAVLSREELDRGVICSSAGNHAQGVALSASVLGCDAVICMPVNSPEIKVAAVQALGGTVELVGETFYEAAAHAVARSKREGRTLINAYDDPLCIAGQGTAGHEILRQVEDADYVFVAVGGGGLISGVASILKAVKPDIKVIGVEPAGANAMTQSLVRGCRVTLSKVDAFADGVAIKLPGAEAFRICRELLDGMVLVDNSAISSAIKEVFNETRSILEPAGAVSVAGAAAFARYYGLQNVSVVAVTSGANMNFDRLRLVSEMANVGVAETMFAARLRESRGCVLRLVDILQGKGPSAGDESGGEDLAGGRRHDEGSPTPSVDGATHGARPANGRSSALDTRTPSSLSLQLHDADRAELSAVLTSTGTDLHPGQSTSLTAQGASFPDTSPFALHEDASLTEAMPLDITEFKYRYTTHHADGQARVLFGVGLGPKTRATRALQRRAAGQGVTTLDVSDVELAQTHLRHMVAGLAGDVADERVFQVTYPERPGMLLRLLRPFSPRWEVTMINFRKSGNRSATLMLGLQIPDEDLDVFEALAAEMHPEFVFEPLQGKAKQLFELFM